MSAGEQPWPTPLAQRLAGRGPMPFRDYMAEALYADEHGYYTRRDLRHRTRSLTDETVYISGLARQLARLFERTAHEGAPRLIEQGAGSGKLMRFLLASLPEELRSELEVIFIEPRLARRTRLVAVIQEFGIEGRVVGGPSSIQPGPGLVVARELVSAFPVHWVEASPDGWREVNVRFPSTRWEPTELLSDPPPHVRAFLETHVDALWPGHRYEVNLQADTWLGSLAGVLDPGVIAVLDRIRPEPAPADGTLIARLDGEGVDPYSAPGHLELSAAVDRDALEHAAGQHALSSIEPPGGLLEASQRHLDPILLATPGALPG